MAEKILIMGESGTGKSTSIRNCDPNITAIVNPVGKPLPFRGSKKFETLNGETDSDRICDFMKAQAFFGKKIIIVDDFQYILAIPYMDRIKETGWDKYNDFGSNYFKIIDVCNELPEDVCVYYLTHCETLESGLTTVKLIGKLLREKITVEGLFTIVLKTGTSEGKYYFFTQNSGKDTVKSPLGMFDSFSIDNDLAYVDAKIRNYYEFDDAKSDEQIKAMDQVKAGEVEKPEPRRRRGGNKTVEEAKEHFVNIAEAALDEDLPFAPVPKVEPNSGEVMEGPRRRRGSHSVESEKEGASKSEVSEDDAAGDTGNKETDRPVNTGRRHKTHDEVVEENYQKIAEYVQAEADAVVAAGDGDDEEVPFNEVKHPEAPALDPVPRRTLAEANEEQPKRRTRRTRD